MRVRACRRSCWAVLLLALAGCSVCSDPAGEPSSTPAAALAFREVRLSAPADGRALVQDVAVCQGRWYAVGAAVRGDGSTAPAVWSSTDATAWTPVPLKASGVYGPKQTLTAVACRGRQVLAVGGAAGGVHGNLRTSTWAGDAAGLTENQADFELFGGPDQIGVGEAAAGPAGWLIGGARTSASGGAGAAVWWSPDARRFTLVGDDPQLRTDARGRTVLVAVAPDPAGGFVAVGSVSADGAVRAPLAWTSADGRRWARQPVPAVPQDAELQAVTADGHDLVAAGLLGRGFAVWRRAEGTTTWRPGQRFGATGGDAVPFVTGLVRGGGALYATVEDGRRFRLWTGAEHGDGAWREVALPVAVPGSGSATVRLAAVGDRMLLATEDGGVSRLWLAGPG